MNPPNIFSSNKFTVVISSLGIFYRPLTLKRPSQTSAKFTMTWIM